MITIYRLNSIFIWYRYTWVVKFIFKRQNSSYILNTQSSVFRLYRGINSKKWICTIFISAIRHNMITIYHPNSIFIWYRYTWVVQFIFERQNSSYILNTQSLVFDFTEGSNRKKWICTIFISVIRYNMITIYRPTLIFICYR